jgi:hypothetical protein
MAHLPITDPETPAAYTQPVPRYPMPRIRHFKPAISPAIKQILSHLPPRAPGPLP